jgi:hypothetical protein
MQGPGTTSGTITLTGLPKNLGKCIAHDLTLLNKLGWRKFVEARRGRKDLAPMLFDHPAKRLLKHYLANGVPVKVSTKPWTSQQREQAINRGPHKSCQLDHSTVLHCQEIPSLTP